MMLCGSIKSLDEVAINRYIAEEKFDGERIMVIKRGKDVSVVNRRGALKGEVYSELTEEMEKLDFDFIIDGEVCSTNGLFNDLQRRALLRDTDKIAERRNTIPIIMHIFDIMELNGQSLVFKPLMERKKILAENKSLKIRRLIGTDNSNWSRKEMAEHVANFASFIASGKYKCKETHTKGFEVVYADHEEKGNSYRRSLLIMNENDRKVGFLFDEFESPMQAAMVLAVKAFFESEWAAALNYGQEQNKVLELDEKRN